MGIYYRSSAHLLQWKKVLVTTFTFLLSCESRFTTLQHCTERPDWLLPCKPPNKNVNFNLSCVPTNSGGFCFVLDPVTFKYRVDARYFPKQPTKDVQNLWIAGRGPGFSGAELILMRSTAMAGKWTTELEFTVDVQCGVLPICPIVNTWDIEIVLYKGDNMDEDRMMGHSFHFSLPISDSVFGSRSFHPPSITVSPWFHGSRVAVKEHTIPLPKDIAASFDMNTDDPMYNMVMMYPPSYEDNLDKKYPLVLVVGTAVVQMVSTVYQHLLVQVASLREAFVVGLSYPAGKECLVLFNNTKEYECKEGMCQADCQTCRDPQRKEPCDEADFLLEQQKCGRVRWCKGKGDVFVMLIEKYVISSVRELVGDRMVIDPPDYPLSIIGYHHGGLFACLVGLMRPGLFKNVACISPSFYIPQLDKLEYHFKYFLRDKVNMYIHNASKGFEHLDQTFYIDVGQNDHVHFPLYPSVAVAHEVLNMLTSMGLKLNRNLFLRETAGFSTYSLSDLQDISYYYRILHPLQLFLHPGGNPSTGNIILPRSLKDKDMPHWSVLNSLHTHKKLGHSTGWDVHDIADISALSSSDDEHKVRYISESVTHQSQCQRKYITVVIFVSSIAVTVVLSIVVTVVCLCLVNSSLGSERKEKDSDNEEEKSSEEEDMSSSYETDSD